MPYGEYEIQKDKCHYSGIEIIQNCKGNKGCIYKQLKRLQAENEILKEKLQISQNSDKKTIEIMKENERLKKEIKQYKKYKFLFEKAKEFKEKTDKWASKCLAENEDLKDTIKRTVCQSECFRYKQANNYKQALQEIREYCEEQNLKADYTACEIIDKINSVIGAE
jgi:hypothetical protein